MVDTQEFSKLLPVTVDTKRNIFIVTIHDQRYNLRPLDCLNLQDPPEQLHCVLKYQNEVLKEVQLDWNYYLNQYYKVNDKAYFKVKSLFPETIELVDKYGFSTYLKKSPQKTYYKDQILECEIVNLDHKRAYVRPISETAPQPDEVTFETSPQQIASFLSRLTADEAMHFAELLCHNETTCSFEHACHLWLSELQDINHLQDISQKIAELMELSNFLSKCGPAEAHFFESRLTTFIEKAHVHIEARKRLQLTANHPDSAEHFIQEMLQKMKISGILFHPEKHFDLLQTLFRLDLPLMLRSMTPLLQVLREHSLTHWMRKSFRPHLVKLLEVYISTINELIYQTFENDAEVIKNLLQALVIQLLLTNHEDDNILSSRINKARLFRCASYLTPQLGTKVLHKAFHCLLDNDIEISNELYQCEAKLIPIQLLQCRQTEFQQNEQLTYDNGLAQLIVSKDGIVIQPSSPLSPCTNVLPKNCMGEHAVTIRLADKIATPGELDKNIPAYKQMWNDIERLLFSQTSINKALVTPLKIGQSVDVCITELLQSNPAIFKCEVVNQPQPIQGIVYLNEVEGLTKGVIPYYLINPTVEDFNPDGIPYYYEAIYCGEDHEGRMVFDLKSVIDDYILQDANDGILQDHDHICSIGSINKVNHKIIGVSEEGYSVEILNSNELNLQKKDIVRCEFETVGADSALIVTATAVESERSYFNIHMAFQQLMRNHRICNDTPTTSLTAEESHLSDSELMDANHVCELMHQMGRWASLTDKHYQAYNYLGLARLMAKMLNRTPEYNYFNGRMELLLLLHDFSINKIIDRQKLEQLEQAEMEFFKGNTTLYFQYRQLKTISYLNQQEKNAKIWAFRESEHDPQLKELATLVLTHNLLQALHIPKAVDELVVQIFNHLNVKERISQLKYYQSENEETEFKTSLVFPPDNTMLPSLEKQTLNILKEVAAFLNHEGGTLYLGVNDAGAGEGLEADLNYSEFSGDKDKYIRYIHVSITQHFGNEVGNYVHIEFDPDNHNRDICLLKIAPYPNGVLLNGIRWVRQNTVCNQLKENEFQAHNARRWQQHPEWNTWKQGAIPHKEESSTDEIEDTIRTAPLDYDNEDRISMGYINFLPDYAYQITDSPRGTTLLSLPFYEEDKFIVLAYQKGGLAKIPIKRFTEKKRDTNYFRTQYDRLVYALRAQPQEWVLRVVESQGKTYIRVDELASLPEHDLNDTGTTLCEPTDRILLCHLLPSEAISQFRRVKQAHSLGCELTTKQGQHNLNIIKRMNLTF